MSQRGGSVVTYVRFGDRVYSPIIDKGEADYIVSFEKMEAARYLPYLKKGGRIVTNTQEIDPMPVITGAVQYPQDLIAKLEAKGAQVDAMDCLTLAEQAGSSKAVNIVLMVLAIMSSNASATMLWSRYCPSLRDTGMVSGATGFLDFLSYMAAAAANVLFANAVTSIGWNNLILVWMGLMIAGVIVSLPYHIFFPRLKKQN
jgi:hypothetical protein